nr:zf-HC2 domain-containing protein [Actinomycetota bacterium]
MKSDPTEHVSEDLRAYTLGGLEPGRSQEVEAHLSSCDACRSELASVRALTDDEPEAMNDLERSRLRRGIEAGVMSGAAGSRGRGPRRLYAALGAAALIVIAVVGGYFGFQGGLSGSDDGGAEGAGTADSAPEGVASDENSSLLRAVRFDRNLGRVSDRQLQALGERGPRRAFALLYAANGSEQEETAVADLTGGLAEAAPPSVRDQVEECLTSVEGTSGSLSPVPYYGALAELGGREVLVLGFAWDASPAGHERLDSYMIYAWIRGGGCDFPISYLSGRIER